MKLSHPTCSALIAAVREGIPAPLHLGLTFGECIIRVECSTEALRDALADYFKEFLAPSGTPAITITAHESKPISPPHAFTIKTPDPGKTKTKEEWVDFPDGRMVRKRLTGMIFLFGEGEHLAVGPCLANANQVINFINNRFIEWKLSREGVLGHASAVTHQGRGLCIAGFSGAGKSTLALCLMEKAATFVSNDHVIVEKAGPGLTMYGVAKHPRINPGTALAIPSLSGLVEPEKHDSFSRMPTEALWTLEHKYDVPIDRYYGLGRFVLKAPMNDLVILNWKRKATPTRIRRVDPRQRKDLLPAFMKATGLFYYPSSPRRLEDPDIDDYIRLLSTIDLYEIAGGTDFHKATEACLGLLKTGRINST